MKLFSLIAAVILLSAQAVPALAADGLPGATVRSESGKAAPERKARYEQWCKENAEKCREMQARREQCKADPEKCRAERQAKMKERQAQCKADPEKCKAERQARREQWCKANPEQCKKMQARREQCQANPEKCKAEMQARSEQRFKSADANNDGKLTREEAQKSMPMVARRFDQIDANKDGIVTMEELQAARKARAGQRNGPGTSLQPDKFV